MAREIPLTGGLVAIVDDEDYERLMAHRWRVLFVRRKRGGPNPYACRSQNVRGRKHYVFMHREVLGLGPGRVPLVDHKDCDGLNNRRDNLRVCNGTQNAGNQPKYLGRGASKYKGVCWHKGHGKWQANIGHQWRQYFLGSFDNEVDAAMAYDAKALELYGEFARVNFPRDGGASALVAHDYQPEEKR